MKVTKVIVGVIECSSRGILIAKRQAGQHLAGLWEFPGGKVEQGETLIAALRRELSEEMGIEVSEYSPLCVIEHTYPEKTVMLNVYRVTGFDGEAHGREGQEIRWVPMGDLLNYTFPEANQEILARLSMGSHGE